MLGLAEASIRAPLGLSETTTANSDDDDDDEAVAEIVYQFVIQNTYTEVVGGFDDDTVEVALGPVNIAVLTFFGLASLSMSLLQCI